MNIVKQIDDTGCGLACVAMIAQVTYKEAQATVFPTATPRKLTFYTRPYQIRKALRGLGIPVAARTVRIREGRKEVMRLNTSALLQVNRQRDNKFHWVVWDHKQGTILDPLPEPYIRLRIFGALFIGETGKEGDE